MSISRASLTELDIQIFKQRMVKVANFYMKSGVDHAVFRVQPSMNRENRILEKIKTS